MTLSSLTKLQGLDITGSTVSSQGLLSMLAAVSRLQHLAASDLSQSCTNLASIAQQHSSIMHLHIGRRDPERRHLG